MADKKVTCPLFYRNRQDKLPGRIGIHRVPGNIMEGEMEKAGTGAGAFSVTIRFYEELNDFLKKYPRKQDLTFRFGGRRSVKDLIESFGVPHVEVDLILVNGESVGFDYIVRDGDRISVYPVFERLDIRRTSLLRENPLRTTRFVLDVHLGKLARHLRLLGFDTDYERFRDDPELAALSAREHRVLLTRDRRLLMRQIVQWGLILRSDQPLTQVEEVLNRLDLWEDIRPFTRCLACNGEIRPVPADGSLSARMKDRIPPKVLAWCRDFYCCSACGRVYWQGSHYDNLMRRVEQIGSRRGQDRRYPERTGP